MIDVIIAGGGPTGIMLASDLLAQDIAVVTSPETEPWGERFAQYRDPNGLIVQLVQWV
ncbi:hypothetical protein [Arthrobacter jiangjiafuii]|uniref:hypothetical protein n=1 Tax=Arthrobacter jiangjiafuii TaxID=2817475 RepID=UPI001F161D55|nr:hypothetical protein [Arthrobacter jiangjiafuii]